MLKYRVQREKAQYVRCRHKQFLNQGTNRCAVSHSEVPHGANFENIFDTFPLYDKANVLNSVASEFRRSLLRVRYC